MAYCPNCNCEVESGALECANCRASFAPGSAWHPTRLPHGPKRVFRRDPTTKPSPAIDLSASRASNPIAREGKILLILILIPELLALIPWTAYSALSAMVFDAGFSSKVAKVVFWMYPFWAYPALIGICGSIAFTLNGKGRLGLALMTMILPPIVSWGGFLGMLSYAGSDSAAKPAMSTASIVDSKRFEEICGSLKIKIYKTVSGARTLFVDPPRPFNFEWLDRLEFTERRSSWNTDKGAYERIRRRGDSKRAPGQSFDHTIDHVNDMQARYSVLVRSSPKSGGSISVWETRIIDNQTQEVLAGFEEGYRSDTQTRCPRHFNRDPSGYKIVAYVLGLADETASKEVRKELGL